MLKKITSIAEVKKYHGFIWFLKWIVSSSQICPTSADLVVMNWSTVPLHAQWDGCTKLTYFVVQCSGTRSVPVQHRRCIRNMHVVYVLFPWFFCSAVYSINVVCAFSLEYHEHNLIISLNGCLSMNSFLRDSNRFQCFCISASVWLRPHPYPRVDQ